MSRNGFVFLGLICCMVGCTTVGSDGRMQRSAGGRAFWSLMIPGVGQFTTGETAKGALMMALNVANNLSLDDDATDDEAATALAISLGIGVWSGIDAYVVADRLNREEPLGYSRSRRYGENVAPAREPPLTIVLDPIGRRVGAALCCRF
ncbi:MAG: hypothetical protein ACYS9X_02180 [Planctomycetota bacterium]|jgi:hypothetical protein